MSNKNCAFTIVAKNYIGLACCLCDSFLKHNKNCDFYIIVADEINNKIKINSYNIVEAKSILDISSDLWHELSFKYNLTEFCTCIKPKSFEYLFESLEYDKIIYLDPDIYVFSSMENIYDKLNNHSIILTPHILNIEEHYTGDLWENIFLGMGSFNLGFIGLRKSCESIKMLKWWNRVLKDECFMDFNRYTATDQKWINYIPMFFSQEEVYITRHMGIDVAPWNFYEREFFINNGVICVKSRNNTSIDEYPLVFVHFSNYKYTELLDGKIIHYALNHDYHDLDIIFRPYINALQKGCMKDYLELPYTYNNFDNGEVISSFNRRIYRRLICDGEQLGNPFDCHKGSFFDVLKKKKLLTRRKAVTTSIRGMKSGRNIQKREKVIDLVIYIVKSILGIDRFNMLSGYIRNRLLPENQTFLYDGKTRPNYK